MESNNQETGIRHMLWAMELIAWANRNKIPSKDLPHVLDTARISVLAATQYVCGDESDDVKNKALGDAIKHMATGTTIDD